MPETTLFADNPWPDSGQGDVIFILDVASAFDKQLLEQWLEKHRPPSRNATIVTLALGGDQSSVDSRPLIERLQVDDQTMLAPLRMVWMPSREALDSGPRLRDFLFGDPRRPGQARARAIWRKNPRTGGMYCRGSWLYRRTSGRFQARPER